MWLRLINLSPVCLHFHEICLRFCTGPNTQYWQITRAPSGITPPPRFYCGFAFTAPAASGHNSRLRLLSPPAGNRLPITTTRPRPSGHAYRLRRLSPPPGHRLPAQLSVAAIRPTSSPPSCHHPAKAFRPCFPAPPSSGHTVLRPPLPGTRLPINLPSSAILSPPPGQSLPATPTGSAVCRRHPVKAFRPQFPAPGLTFIRSPSSSRFPVPGFRLTSPAPPFSLHHRVKAFRPRLPATPPGSAFCRHLPATAYLLPPPGQGLPAPPFVAAIRPASSSPLLATARLPVTAPANPLYNPPRSGGPARCIPWRSPYPAVHRTGFGRGSG